MFITTEDTYEQLYKWLKDKPTTVQISTFGIYAGILDSGKDIHEVGGKYSSQTHDLIDSLNEKTKVQVLVGVAPYRSCKDKGKVHCQDCYEAYGKNITRILMHARRWPNIDWRFRSELHLKCTIFNWEGGTPKGTIIKQEILGGGRNLTDSDWADVSFNLPRNTHDAVTGYFNEQWSEALPITEENIVDYITTSFEKMFDIKT